MQGVKNSWEYPAHEQSSNNWSEAHLHAKQKVYQFCANHRHIHRLDFWRQLHDAERITAALTILK